MTTVRREQARTVARVALAVCYAVAGTLHLRVPAPFIAITPSWVPRPALVIAGTGWCELAGAAGLLFPPTRRLAGAMLALYAVAVFPANINHAINHIAIDGRALGWWYHGPRLALQPLIVLWALFAGGVLPPDNGGPGAQEPARTERSRSTG